MSEPQEEFVHSRVSKTVVLSKADYDALIRERDALREEVARWKVCENCGEPLTAPGICDRAVSEKEKGLEQMHEDTLTRAEKAEAERDALLQRVQQIRELSDEGMAFVPRMSQVAPSAFEIWRDDLRFLLQFRVRLQKLLPVSGSRLPEGEKPAEFPQPLDTFGPLVVSDDERER